MEALEIFIAVTRELDRYSSPTFEAGDFNYFVNKAVDKIIDDGIEDFRKVKIISDALKVVKVTSSITFNATDSTNLREVPLPDNYRKEAVVIPTFRYVKEAGCNKKGNKFSKAAKELTGNMEPVVMHNYYHKPLVKRPYYTIAGGKLGIRFDSVDQVNTEAIIEKVSFEYFRDPELIVLSTDGAYTSVMNSEFPDKVNRNIIETCTMLFLENKQNPRLQSNVEVNQIKKSE